MSIQSLKEPQVVKTIFFKNLLKKNRVINLTLPDFKTYYNYSNQNCSTGIIADQWNITEIPEINPHMCGQMNFKMGARTTQWENNCIFNKWSWEI